MREREGKEKEEGMMQFERREAPVVETNEIIAHRRSDWKVSSEGEVKGAK